MIDYYRLKNEILQELNWIRSAPSEVADLLLTTRVPLYRGVYIHLPYGRIIKTMEGVTALEELITQLNLSAAVDVLEWSPGLARAAEVHAHEMGVLGLVSHKDPRNRDLPQRLKPYCDVKGKATQLIELSGVEGKEIMFELLIDDGLASRSRRKAIISPLYKHVGIGIARHKTYGHITVIILAQSVAEIQYVFPQPQVIVVPQYVSQPPPHVSVPQQPVIVQQVVDTFQHAPQSAIQQFIPVSEPHLHIHTPPLEMIPQVPESKITTVTSNVYQQSPIMVQHQSLPVTQDVTRNRLLYAQTYNKNVFGGERNQQCLLF